MRNLDMPPHRRLILPSPPMRLKRAATQLLLVLAAVLACIYVLSFIAGCAHSPAEPICGAATEGRVRLVEGGTEVCAQDGLGKFRWER